MNNTHALSIASNAGKLLWKQRQNLGKCYNQGTKLQSSQ